MKPTVAQHLKFHYAVCEIHVQEIDWLSYIHHIYSTYVEQLMQMSNITKKFPLEFCPYNNLVLGC